MDCFSKLCTLFCCKVPEEEGELPNEGRATNERQPLLQQDPLRSPPGRSEYGLIGIDRRRTGFSTVFAQPPPNDVNGYENRNYIYLRPSSPRRFRKMRQAQKCIKTEKFRELKFAYERRDTSVCELTGGDGFTGKSAEDEMLAVIVEETAASMVDLTIDPTGQSLDRHEVQERSKWYAERLEGLSPLLIQQPCVGTGLLLADVHTPFLFHKINSTDVISKEDFDLMDWATEEISQGLSSIREYFSVSENGHNFVVPYPSLALAKENLERRADSL